MNQLISTIRTAFWAGEGKLSYLQEPSYLQPEKFKATQQIIRQGEALALAWNSYYPHEVVGLGQNDRELAEASFVFNAGRLLLLGTRLSSIRGGDYNPKVEDYRALVNEVGEIASSDLGIAFRMKSVSRAHRYTTLPLLVGAETIKAFLEYEGDTCLDEPLIRDPETYYGIPPKVVVKLENFTKAQYELPPAQLLE